MLVKEAMSKKVVTFSENETIFSVLQKFVKNNISGGPVIDNKKHVVGIISESDIIKAIDAFSSEIKYQSDTSFAIVLAFLRSKKNKEFESIKKELSESKDLTVGKFMIKDVKTISPEEDIFQAIKMMDKYHVKRIPVVENNKLVGIIARADVIRALSKKV